VVRGWHLLCIPLLWVQFAIAQDATASLSGEVRDVTGVALHGVGVELRSEKGRLFKSTSDPAGTYAFSNLPADEYTLKIGAPGFTLMTVQDIVVADAERKVIPPLTLNVAMNCGEHAIPKYLRLVPSDGHGASFRGTVKVDRGFDKPYGRPVKDAQVTLACPGGTACKTAKTDVNGEFLFTDLNTGSYSLRVQHSGFYKVQATGYDIQDGFEWNAWPLSIERCPLGDCDPRKRPKRPLNICE